MVVPPSKQGFRRLRRRVDQNGAGLGEYARQFLAQFLAQLVVEVGERLVEQNQSRALDEGARNGGALLLAAGELRGQALQKIVEPQQTRRFAHARVDLGAPDARDPKRGGDVLEDRERGIVDELLIDHRNGAAADRNVGDVHAAFDQPARGRPVQSGHETHERGLSRQRRAQQDVHRALVERQRNVVDDGFRADRERNMFKNERHSTLAPFRSAVCGRACKARDRRRDPGSRPPDIRNPSFERRQTTSAALIAHSFLAR